MNAATLKALRGSIKKWEGIVEGTANDLGIQNCPLCHMFHANFCQDCPVSKKTGLENCAGSPYYLYNPRYPKTAQLELDFLKSLLPKKRTRK